MKMEEKGQYSPDDMVWVNLGKSYGWWPAQVQDQEKRAKFKSEILNSLGPEFERKVKIDSEIIFVKFFDDDQYEWYEVKDPKRIKKYSCKDKLKLIKNGFKNLDETKKVGLGGVNLRLAQFYKDVEMAEVMTDNNPKVGEILALYEVAEIDENMMEPPPVDNHPPNNIATSSSSSSSKSSQKSKKKSSRKSDNVLREIKNGGVTKKSRKKR